MSRECGNAWDAALHTIEKLRARGHVALLAGGCVRDRLLDREPKDYDVVTDATPQRVKTIFPRAKQVGAKFGVMLVRKFGHEIEVATFRSDGPYSDGRHPDAVTFGSDIEDARRRDFTINGLFLDPSDDRVIDYVDGRADIEAGIVRTIGDPDRRFREDHLRMLRAVRFAARFGFEVERETLESIKRHAEHLSSISAERVWIELEMILTDPSRISGWSLLFETGLHHHLASGWLPQPDEDPVIKARLAALPPRPISAALALAVTLPDREREQVTRICRSLRLSNRLSNAVAWLVASLPRVRAPDSLDLADVKLLMSKEPWEDLLDLLRVDTAGRETGPEVCEQIRDRIGSIPPEAVAPPPLLSGDDLNSLGLQPGPRTGQVLDAVYRAQLNLRINNREDAIRLARTLIAD